MRGRTKDSAAPVTPEKRMYEWLINGPRKVEQDANARTSEAASEAEVAALKEARPAVGLKDHRRLQDLVRPHVDSFNFFLG